jgi:hypothetical protein
MAQQKLIKCPGCTKLLAIPLSEIEEKQLPKNDENLKKHDIVRACCRLEVRSTISRMAEHLGQQESNVRAHIRANWEPPSEKLLSKIS